MRPTQHSGMGNVPGNTPAPTHPFASLVASWPGPAALVARDGTLRQANAFAAQVQLAGIEPGSHVWVRPYKSFGSRVGPRSEVVVAQ